jgi:hypothetical protein
VHADDKLTSAAWWLKAKNLRKRREVTKGRSATAFCSGYRILQGWIEKRATAAEASNYIDVYQYLSTKMGHAHPASQLMGQTTCWRAMAQA